MKSLVDFSMPAEHWHRPHGVFQRSMQCIFISIYNVKSPMLFSILKATLAVVA